MQKVIFKENACKGCGLCVHACPKKILKIDTSRVNAVRRAPCNKGRVSSA